MTDNDFKNIKTIEDIKKKRKLEKHQSTVICLVINSLPLANRNVQLISHKTAFYYFLYIFARFNKKSNLEC